jgi:AraC family transcriptional regulator
MRLAEGPTAIGNLCALPARGTAPEHRHANPYLSLHLLGGYREAGDNGEHAVQGPGALFFAAGSAHGMAIGEFGLASVIIEFDAGWLRRRLGPRVDLQRSQSWLGGEIGLHASRLARLWLSSEVSPPARLALTEAFLASAMRSGPAKAAPPWLDELDVMIRTDRPPRTTELARRLGLSPSWLTQAYRHWRGQGLTQALQRQRLADAALRLEDRAASLADVAAAAGFCDQSHMTRTFRRHLGRTPAQVRELNLGLSGS